MLKILILCFIFFFMVLPIFSLPAEWESYFREQCSRAGVPVEIAMAILMVENPGLDPAVVSKENPNGTRDYGLWQLNSRYLWSDFVLRYWHNLEPFRWDDPFHNTYLAVKHLQWLYSIFCTDPVPQSKSYNVIVAYNCGFVAVLSGKVPAASANYAALVVRQFRRLVNEREV